MLNKKLVKLQENKYQQVFEMMKLQYNKRHNDQPYCDIGIDPNKKIWAM